jgi:molecular chaperone HtpG
MRFPEVIDVSEASARTLEFKTELEQLLDIIVHSLYSEREIFLRELVSNASDAIDKLRFECIARPELLGDESTDWQIELRVDPDAGTLSVIDNGIGMSAESIVDQLGTIARSGTREFMATLRAAEAADRPELIGQFGVGFYSAFMVADRVTVFSRHAGTPGGVKWESAGKGTYTLEEIDRAARGTEVVLHLREDAREFLQEYRLRRIVKKYSDFLEHPIVMEVERTEGEGDAKVTTRTKETLNSRKALWLRRPEEVSAQEHEEFYRQISHDFHAPGKVIHFKAEGTLEYRALLYLPSERPMDFHWGEPKGGLQLYIQRVFIMDRCEDLLPSYLRFVKGVVDSSDLPLNVSREMLQKNRTVEQIEKGLVNKVLKTLEETKKDDRESYEKFFAEFGSTLKEGVAHDPTHRDRIAELLLFASTRTSKDETVDLPTYVERMPEGQEHIWYLTGEKRELLAQSPALEALREKGEEVLLLTDPVDEFLVAHLHEFGGKQLRAADRGALDAKEVDSSKQEEFEGLLAHVKTCLPEVTEVRLSQRLRGSAAVLVAGEYGVSAHMERLMKRMGRENELPQRERILELNADHAAVQALRALHAADHADPRIEDYAHLLYEQAVIAEGSPVSDPAAMAARINRLIEVGAKA